MSEMAVEAVIFDMDGLLLDTESIYTRAITEVHARYGKPFDMAMKARVMGRPAHEVAQYTVDTLELPLTPEAYLAERNMLLEQMFPHAEAKPGASALVRHFNAHQVPIAVATGSSRPLLVLKAQRHDWFALFNAIVSAEDPTVARGKPEPDVFLVAADALGCDPTRCLAFEDSPVGAQAAAAAGMRVVAVPESFTDRDLFDDGVAFLDSLADFTPEAYGLPMRVATD